MQVLSKRWPVRSSVNYPAGRTKKKIKMDNTYKIPFYAKVALVSISLFAFVYTLHLGQRIILPIVYATIIAILLNPLVNYLVSKKFNKIVSISLAVALALFILFGVLYIVS